MTSRTTRLLAPALLAITLGGCATLDPDAGFDDVRAAVSERTGREVQWRRSDGEDGRIAARVRELLAAELTADAAVQVALLNNPRLQATYEELGIAQAALVQASLVRNPLLHAGWLYEGGGGSPATIDVGLSFSLLDALFIPMRKRMAAGEFEAAKLRVTGAVLDLESRVRGAYYRAQAALQRLDMYLQAAASTAIAHDYAQRLHRAGNISDLALAQQRAMHESVRLDVAAAELDARGAHEELNVLLGLWGGDTRWTLARRLPDVPAADPDVAEVERRAVERSLDLAIARAQIERAAAELGVADSTRFVRELEIGISAEREEGHWTRGPALGVPLPLFDTGEARLAAAASALRRGQREYFATAVELRSAARRGTGQLKVARQRAALLKEVVLPLHSQIASESLLHYNAMQVGLPQLLAVQRQQIDSGRRYVDALLDYWLARSDLELILNGRLPSMTGPARAAVPAAAGMAADTGGH